MKGAIMLSGGGGTKLFAAIGVTYPAGSTVTCTKGTKTLTAENTSGQWVFAIPEAGTWTVTSTDGTNSKSQSVSITTEGQFERVELSYSTYLFKSGDQCDDLTGGWYLSYDKSSGSSAVGNTIKVVSVGSSSYSDAIASSKNTVDLSGFTTLYAHLTAASGVGVTLTVSSTAGNANYGAVVATAAYALANIPSDNIISLDISTVESGYVELRPNKGGRTMSQTDIEADEIWME